MKYIIALDQGTTSSRSIVFDNDLRPVASAQREFRQIYPQPGWVEHDPYDILSTQTETLREAVSRAGISTADIAAIGIANQRETAVLWNRKTGAPVHKAIVWQCRRTAARCSELQAQGCEPDVRARTGLVLDAYFSGSKLQWMLDNVPGARAQAQRGELAFGTVDSWLLWNLTADHRHCTDAANASRTMLYNIHTGAWDEEMLRLFDVPEQVLPQVLPNAAPYGLLRRDVLGREIPILSIAGDQQAALFGQACFAEGDVKNTYGTGCFLLMNTGGQAVDSANRLLTTVAWDLGHGLQYALEGSVFMAGAVLQWLRDELGLIRTAAESEELALSVPDTGGVYLVPAFTGLGAPWWDMYARGTITGLTRGSGRAHIVRAALEAIALQSLDVLRAMEADAGHSICTLRVDGGASSNRFLMQFQADLLACPVLRPACAETTALGAAAMAALAAGIYSGTDELAKRAAIAQRYEPRGDQASIDRTVSGWHKAVSQAMRNVGSPT